MGGDGVPAAQAFGVTRLERMPRFARVAVEEAGADLIETYTRDA
jgi:diaminohydroxyphosphoribosylaminopyrimidine deaminase/5-amino-6-(5-phosphoribosylamino)uracil reductase